MGLVHESHKKTQYRFYKKQKINLKYIFPSSVHSSLSTAWVEGWYIIYIYDIYYTYMYSYSENLFLRNFTKSTVFYVSALLITHTHDNYLLSVLKGLWNDPFTKEF